MKRTWTVAAAGGLMLGSSVPELADGEDEELQPATNANNCAEVSGEWWDNGLKGNDRVTTCTVGGEGAPSVVACWNHQGNPVEDFEDSPHCVPAG